MSIAYCFDLDGVITKEEILPLIANDINFYHEMELLTDLTIRGEIPFEHSFQIRCEMLKRVSVSRVTSIVADVPLHELIADFIRKNSEFCFIVTGNLDVWVHEIAEKIGVKYYSSRGTVVNDQLISVDHVINKGDAIKDLKEKFDTIVAVGDGMGDANMFEESDICIAFGAVHPPVASLIDLSDFVCYSEDSLCRLLKML